MKEILENIFNLLNSVLPKKVFYGTNQADNGDNATKPYIIYQEISKRNTEFADDKSLIKIITIQINLVTNAKDLNLEKKLEDELELSGLNFEMISELSNDDSSVNRVYEIKKEVIKKHE